MILTVYGDYIRHYGNKIWIGSLIRLLTVFGYREQVVRVAVSRMMKQGLLQSERSGNKSHYQLTDKGMGQLAESVGRMTKLQNHKWDGQWRVIMYNLPEEKRQVRDELRKELQWKGFGNLSNGCWVSPNNLEDEVAYLISKFEIEEYVHLFLSEHIVPESPFSIVEKCWRLEGIAEKYEDFINVYSKKFIIYQSMIQNGEISDEECFIERTHLLHDYRKLLLLDPFLPKELLPERWNGHHAALLFHQYNKILAAPSNRFFEAVFQEKNDLRRKDKDYHSEEYLLLSGIG
jgi:phenylacetic acid degradation operon negative regulatory protein